MKIICLLLSLAFFGDLAAQGKFVTPEFESLIGTKYQDQSELLLLHDFTSRGGSLISRVNDPEKFIGEWYSKGSTFVVLFELVDEEGKHEILDALVIEKARSNQELLIGLCTYGESEMPGLVALVNSRNNKRLKALRAWNLNRDKVRIEAFAAEKVTCLGMVGED